MRVPFVARFPGAIPKGITHHGVASSIDLMPTVSRLTGAPLPRTIIDGHDIWPLLSGQTTQFGREVFLYFNDIFLQCARVGTWKLHATRFNTPAYAPAPSAGIQNLRLPSPELYDLRVDPQESYDRSSENPGMVADILTRMNKMIETFPQNVQDVWKAAMATPVQQTPTGALPIAQGS